MCHKIKTKTKTFDNRFCRAIPVGSRLLQNSIEELTIWSWLLMVPTYL